MTNGWYGVISGNEVQQGDILFDFEFPVAREPVGEPPLIDVFTYDVIVMTQSCDIPKASIDHLILCPVWELDALSQNVHSFGDNPGKENLRKGFVFAYHLLAKCEIPEFQRDFLVVQFERVIERPKISVQQFVAHRENRLRLLPPYREQLSQSFARFFMRVGLPLDIPPFT